MKQKFITIISLSTCLLLSVVGCKKGERKEFKVEFQNGKVTFSNPVTNSTFNVYQSDSKDGNYKEILKDQHDKFTTDDIYSYFVFESIDGNEISKPYSYIYSAFDSENVKIITENDDPIDVQNDIDNVYNRMEWDEFSLNRYAYLYMPGDYSTIQEKVGYYTTVFGLGYTPDDVTLKTVSRYNSPLASGALCNFWCGIENFSTNESVNFYVSQATYLRRMHIHGDITLSDSGYSSGGFLANSVIDGEIKNTTQQQYLFRNDEWKSYNGNVDINMVYSGVKGKINYKWPEQRVTILNTTNRIKEKPFLVFDDEKGLGLFQPSLKENTSGVSFNEEDGDFHSLNEFYIAHSDKDTSITLNEMLKKGKSIIFTPGTYEIESPLNVTSPKTILFGMGMATLRSSQDNKEAILKTDDVDGLVISDLLFEAGSVMENMIVVGDNTNHDHKDNPTLLADIFLRLGGNINRTNGCENGLVINSCDVIGDNFWLWRADHGMDRDVFNDYINEDGTLPNNIGELTDYKFWKGIGVGWKNQSPNNYATHGAIINGDRVSLYGLMCEHFGEYQTIWNGDDGYLVFYQSETPYDCPDQNSWKKGDQRDDQGYASYKVDDDVSTHTAYGIGVYYVHNDTNNEIVMDHAIEAPETDGIELHHMAIANFKANKGCGIRYILNKHGQGNIAPYTSQKTSLTSLINGKITK